MNIFYFIRIICVKIPLMEKEIGIVIYVERDIFIVITIFIAICADMMFAIIAMKKIKNIKKVKIFIKS